MKVLVSLCVAAFMSLLLFAQTPATVPRIWDDQALADWATPIAALNLRPSHYSSAEYYSVPGENLRTYPLYPPDKEPPGYWEELQKKKPEPLVDVSKIRSAADWVAAGAPGTCTTTRNSSTGYARARAPADARAAAESACAAGDSRSGARPGKSASGIH